jgi:hypothetical protein
MGIVLLLLYNKETPRYGFRQISSTIYLLSATTEMKNNGLDTRSSNKYPEASELQKIPRTVPVGAHPAGNVKEGARP